MASARDKKVPVDPAVLQAVRDEIRTCLQREFEGQLKGIGEFVRAEVETRLSVQSELERSMKALAEAEREIAVLVDDATVELSQIIHKKTACSELMAYVRGLTYQLNRTDAKK